MERKGLLGGIPKNLPELEYTCSICILTKSTKITIVPTTDVSNPPPGFMLQMEFAFFNVESIHVFISTFVAICSDTSHPFGLPSRSKRPPLDILKFIVTTLRNQDKKVAFIRVDADLSLARSYELIKTCHSMNIMVQTTGLDASSLNGKCEICNKKIANLTFTIERRCI